VSKAHSRCSWRKTHPLVFLLTATDISAVLRKTVAQTSRSTLAPNARYTAPHTRRCREVWKEQVFKVVSGTNYPRQKSQNLNLLGQASEEGIPRRAQDCSTGEALEGFLAELKIVLQVKRARGQGSLSSFFLGID
jgi:hypothetical protein